jgi:hypothetical protein
MVARGAYYSNSWPSSATLPSSEDTEELQSEGLR